MPIMPSDCVAMARPIDDGRKFSCSIAACTRAAASAEIGPLPEMAREAVDMPTPASAATSLSVATRFSVSHVASNGAVYGRCRLYLQTRAARVVEQRDMRRVERKRDGVAGRDRRLRLIDRGDLHAMIIE